MRSIYGEKKINLPSEFLEDVNELTDDQVNHNDTYFLVNLDTPLSIDLKKDGNLQMMTGRMMMW